MDDDVSLRDLMETKFENLNRRIDELRNAIEKMAANTVSAERFNSTYNKVVRLEQAMADMDKRLDVTDRRVDKAEGYIGIWRYIGAGIVTIIIALAIAYLSGRLNL